MFGQSLLSAFGIACTTDTDQLFGTNQSVTSTATYQLNASPVTSIPGNNYPGTASNITFAAGKFGNAAVFNGSNSKIIANGKPLNNNTSITISFWARNINSSDWKTLLGEGGDSGNTPGYKIYTSPPSVANSNYLWMARADNTGYVFDTYDGSAANKGGVNMGIAGSTWVHCVFTVSPTQLIVYKNGVNVKSLSISNTSSVVGYYDFQFMYDTKYNRYLQGELDQVRLFDTTLSQAAVTALYNETTTTAQSASIDYVDANPNSIAYYKMADTTDQIGGNTLTNSNVNFNTEGKFGFAGKFNGSNSKLTISNSSFLPQGNNSRSISCWIKTTGGSNDGVIGYGNAANSQAFFIYINNQNKLGIYCYYDNTDGTIAISNNTWNHVVATYDGTNCKLYVNGVLDFTTAKTLNTGTGEFRIGGVNWNNGAEFFPGDIDQIRLYDSALSAANVSTLYKEVECEPAAINALANFNTVIYTGNGPQQVGFKPGFTWIKNRDSTPDHVLFDTIRGVQKFIRSNNTDPEATGSGASGQDYLSSFNTNGFTVGNASNTGSNSVDYVSWNWKAALANLSTSFNGTSSEISLGNSQAFSVTNTGEISFSLWINSTDSDGGYVFAKGDDVAIKYEQNLYLNTNGTLNAAIYNSAQGTAASVTTTATVNDGNWHHVVVTIDDGSSMSIYVDNGTPVTTTSWSGTVAYESTVPFFLGAFEGIPATSSKLNGKLAQVRVFNKVLSSSETSDLYAEPAASNNTLNYPAGAGCIAAYPLQTDAVDLSGNYSGASSNVTFGQPGYLTSNTDGTITSTVAANQEAGFSIVKYTGSTPNQTIGHGLGKIPELIIVKNLDVNGNGWATQSPYSGGADYHMMLNNTQAAQNNVDWIWNDTEPTSTVFTVGQNSITNGNGEKHISYCFVSIPGYSKIGSYVGTSASGNVQYLEFEPAFLMIKRTDSTGSWIMLDNKRSTSNPRTKYLTANTSDAEGDSASIDVDFLTNGFSVGGTNTDINVGTYIFIAIA